MTKNHSNVIRSIRKPENPARMLPGNAQSDVSRANWLAAYCVDVIVDMYVMSTIDAKA